MGTVPSLDSTIVERLFKMFSIHDFKALLDLGTETMAHVGQRYAPHKDVLAVSQTGSVHGEIVSSLKQYDEQINNFHNISVAETTIQCIFTCEEFESIMNIKIDFWWYDHKWKTNRCHG